MAVQEKRRYPRIRYHAPVCCKMRGQARYANTSIDDISLGGLSFTFDSFIPPNNYLILEFSMRQHQLNPVARVAWTNSVPFSQKYRCGVEFSEINQENRQCIKEFCAINRAS